ncbi:hypothetical protein BJ085DRAFT_36616, partial [Dimargaris cristalligena]
MSVYSPDPLRDSPPIVLQQPHHNPNLPFYQSNVSLYNGEPPPSHPLVSPTRRQPGFPALDSLTHHEESGEPIPLAYSPAPVKSPTVPSSSRLLHSTASNSTRADMTHRYSYSGSFHHQHPNHTTSASSHAPPGRPPGLNGGIDQLPLVSNRSGHSLYPPLAGVTTELPNHYPHQLLPSIGADGTLPQMPPTGGVIATDTIANSGSGNVQTSHSHRLHSRQASGGFGLKGSTSTRPLPTAYSLQKQAMLAAASAGYSAGDSTTTSRKPFPDRINYSVANMSLHDRPTLDPTRRTHSYDSLPSMSLSQRAGNRTSVVDPMYVSISSTNQRPSVHHPHAGDTPLPAPTTSFAGLHSPSDTSMYDSTAGVVVASHSSRSSSRRLPSSNTVPHPAAGLEGPTFRSTGVAPLNSFRTQSLVHPVPHRASFNTAGGGAQPVVPSHPGQFQSHTVYPSHPHPPYNSRYHDTGYGHFATTAAQVTPPW